MAEAKNTDRMPAIFIGHGSPMLALEDSKVTHELARIGQKVLTEHGLPRAILMISAHWYKSTNLVQRTAHPEQIFDMYGFPRALYEVKYQPEGYAALSDAVLGIKELGAKVDNNWGIDHGAWTPLVHMFPEADIPVVQLTVNGVVGPRQNYEIGQLLAGLRDQGYLIIGSGNVVHNLRQVDWENAHGTREAEAFNDFIVRSVEQRNDDAAINFSSHTNARYAVPTPDHYLPLLYVLGASQGEKPLVFNNMCTLGAMAMTGFYFE